MKKFTILTSVLIVLMLGFSGVISSQELMTNGDLEAWDDPTTPTSWDKAESVTQESGTVHGGTYSAKQQAGTKDLMQNVGGIVGGGSYTISYYYLDNDVDAKSRIFAYWTSGGTTLTDNAAELRSSTYSSDDPAWVLWTVTLTAPATADGFRFEVRSYNDNAGSGFIYYDDFSVFNNGAATPSISKAYAISETELEVEYTIDITAVTANDYSLTGSSTITFTGATIDGSNGKLVHLTGPSSNMIGDITLDNIADAANSSNFDFYAGIMPVSFVNTTNPGGTMNNTNIATFQGIVSANDAYNNVWLSDAAGVYNGVLIYNYDFDALVAVGDEVIFTASRTTYNSLTELENPQLISIISNGNTPYGPDVIPGSDIDQSIASDTDPGEKWEGQLVKVENFTVDSYVDYDYTCSWSDGTNTYYFKVGDNVDYHLDNITLNIGQTYGSVTGVVDWYNSGPYYRINPRDQTDVAGSSATARIVGSMNGWSTTDPDYVMNMNANGLYELTKSLDAGDHEYKVLEGDDWGQPNYPGNNQHVILTGTEDVTWKTNINADLVTHTLPVVAGNFLSQIGGNDWDPTELIGEMTDPDGDDIFTLVLTIPAGNWEGKVTLNNNWDQSTGGNVPFVTDGVNSTTFTYDFPNNTTTISGPPPPTVTITFIVDDNLNMNYDGFFLKGSWDANGQYDPSWGGGMEHSAFYDDGTHGDVTADDHIWTCQQDLVVDGGSNTWEWGVNDSESNWITGNWQFTVPNQTPQTLTWLIPDVVDLVINEIMYNSPGTDEEWIELYNNTDQTIDLENWDICDNDASHTHIIIPAGYSVDPDSYFTISIATGGAFPFTPDYDGTGNFALNNTGDAVRIWNPSHLLVDIVVFDDSSPWPSEPDGGGPTLSLFQPYLDNALAENWRASNQDIGTPGAVNFPINITTPNGGEVIETNSTFDIMWTVEGWDGNIRIELLKDGQDPVLLVSNLPVSNGSFSWFVFDNLETAADYKILISNMDDTNPFDESDDNFSIVAGYVMPEIVITEIMYNPPESGNDSLEFIELYNNGLDPVNLEGFMFSAGVEFTFPNVELLPDNYLLVSINSAAMLETFGVDSYQWTGGALSNSGEKIELIDALNNVLDSLTYDDSLPWDTLADGYGPSLTLCNPDADNSVAENWTHSVNFAALNSVGDSIWATPGFGCQVEFLPGFIADVTVISVGESVMFTDQTIGNPIEWIWTFEGGTPDTYTGQTPPAIVYDTEGAWDVTLYVSDGINTGEVTYPDYIEVVNYPAPTNLVATVGSFDDVQLTWSAPGGSSAELIYDNDVTTGAYSYEGYTMSTQMSPESACKVLTLKFYTTIQAGDNTFNANVYGWDGTQPGTTVVFTQSVTAVDEAWLEVDVSNEDITFDGDFVVGFGSINATTFIGYDGGLNNGRSWDFDNVSLWEQWTEAYLIRAVVQYSSGKIVEIGVPSHGMVSNNRITENTAHPVDYNGLSYVKPIENQVQNVRSLLGYNVYRDDVMINTATVAVTEYNDPEPTIGSHDYYVTAVYDGGESVPSNVVTVLVTDINELVSTSVVLYPNPTDGRFKIELSDGITANVAIMDITGKEVYNTTMNGSIQVNVSDLQQGMYFVRIHDTVSNSMLVKKLIVR